MIAQVQGTGISTEQQKKNWLINWYFENDPMGSIYLATLRNPSLVASFQTSPGMLYGTPFATGMENYFQKIKTHFGQSMFDQLLTEFAQQSNLYVDEIKVDEWHIYGSSRLGVYEANRTISKRIASDLNNDNQITNNEYVIETPEEVMYLYSNYQLERGAKRYELTNHLGNVLTVISDKKTANFTGTNFTHFTAERISATDYSPFGAPLAGRTWNGGEYRYGFNSMEKYNEINGTGNAYDFGARIYDARLGRWMSVDPHFKRYPNKTPFNAVNNNPIFFGDDDGKDGVAKITPAEGENSLENPDKLEISATYYYNLNEIGSYSELPEALKTAAEEWNNTTFTIFNNNDGRFYQVSFKLEVKPGEKSDRGSNDNVFTYPGVPSFGNGNFVNVDDPLAGEKPQVGDVAYASNTSITLMSKEIDNFIKENNLEDKTKSFLVEVLKHEIGHSLGLQHLKKGIMKETMYALLPQQIIGGKGMTTEPEVPKHKIGKNEVQNLVNNIVNPGDTKKPDTVAKVVKLPQDK